MPRTTPKARPRQRRAREATASLDLRTPARRPRTAAAARTPRKITGIVLGTVVKVGREGTVRVRVHVPVRGLDDDGGIIARALVPLGRAALGREVAVAFAGGDPTQAVVLGLLWQPEPAPPSPFTVEADGTRVTVHADEQLVLRCGEASITLTRAGKVLVRGAYVSSRASGVHRIMGGTVEIN
jgi:hypothetical protein